MSAIFSLTQPSHRIFVWSWLETRTPVYRRLPKAWRSSTDSKAANRNSTATRWKQQCRHVNEVLRDVRDTKICKITASLLYSGSTSPPLPPPSWWDAEGAFQQPKGLPQVGCEALRRRWPRQSSPLGYRGFCRPLIYSRFSNRLNHQTSSHFLFISMLLNHLLCH